MSENKIHFNESKRRMNSQPFDDHMNQMNTIWNALNPNKSGVNL